MTAPLRGLGAQAAASAAVRSGAAQHLTILQTADLHGQLETHDEFFWEGTASQGRAVYARRGGLARIKTLVDGVRRTNPQGSLLVESGDCISGGGVAALSRGDALVPLVNAMGYDMILPGNWEVVYGKDRLQSIAEGYTAPVVCANMHHSQAGANLFRPYWVSRVAGLKVGFIGYNDPLTGTRQPPAFSAGITFTAPEQTVAEHVRTLREDNGCQLVFLVTHLGLTQQLMLAGHGDLAGVDYILGADTHERVRAPLQPDGGGVPVTEPGSFGSFVGRLDLVVQDGVVKDRSYELLEVDPREYDEEPAMRALVDRARAPYRDELDREVGTTATPLVRYFVLETPMDNLITDALRAKTGTDIALSQGFRFCPPLVPGESGTASITKEYLWSMLAVDSQVKSGTVTGQQILDWWETDLHKSFAADPAERTGGWVVRCSGMTMNFTADAEPGHRVNWVRVGDAPLDPARTYTVCAGHRDGEPENTMWRLSGATGMTRHPFTVQEAIEEYLAANSPVSPTVEGRVTATDRPQSLLTQVHGTTYEFH